LKEHQCESKIADLELRKRKLEFAKFQLSLYQQPNYTIKPGMTAIDKMDLWMFDEKMVL
jgi:hypothetical protein